MYLASAAEFLPNSRFFVGCFGHLFFSGIRECTLQLQFSGQLVRKYVGFHIHSKQSAYGLLGTEDSLW